MQSRVLQQLLLALSSLTLSKPRDVIGSGLSCLRSSPADEGQTRVTFLREDAAGVRSVYRTMWSEDARLVTCDVDSSPLATERYRALCDGGSTGGQEITQRFNVSALSAPDAPRCAPVSSSAPERTSGDATRGKARRKRAWIVPGTLWCGHGSKAVRYDQLGMFEDTDRCCREHDHCLDIIPAFTVNYGIFNSNFYTVSRCDCDHRFRQCLLKVNDTISTMVGYSFFSILRVPCFELKQQKRCTKMYWWGMCKVAKKAPYAVFKNPLPYNTSDVTKYEDNAGRNKSISRDGQPANKSSVISPHRNSNKSENRCGSRDPPRGDTFHRRRTKGRGCKTHHLSAVASSQKPPASMAHTTTASIAHTTRASLAHTTTPSRKTDALNASKTGAVMSNKRRVGKERSTRKGLLANTTQRSQVPPQVITNSYPQTSSTTQSPPPPLTQRQTPQPHLPTATTAAVTKTRKGHKKAGRQSHCCGSRMPVRGDAFWPRCKKCPKQETTTHMTTAAAATTTNGLPVKVTTETPKQDTLKILWNAATLGTSIATKPKTAASLRTDGKPQKWMDSHLLGNNTSRKPMGGTAAQRSLKHNNALRNMTDNQPLCGSLKRLDECKYQIPPLEKKYDLQNMESKTAYHCDCTSRLAAQIKSFKQPSILPTLLMDFVSQYCFKLPKEKKCRRKKSCSGGFIKASDLLQALKKIEEKDTAGVRKSGSDRKRGIPVRLYKRCLRLEREADVMAQLT